MTEPLADIDARLKEAQQKAIELQQQREMLRQEQIDKMRDESLKAEKADAERIHNEMTAKEREALDKYVDNLPRNLTLLMNEQRAQHNGMTLTPEGWRPQPILTQAQETQLLDRSLANLEYKKNQYVADQTKDLQQEWNAVTQKALEQQAEKDRLQAERDKLKDQGLEKVAAQATKQEQGHNPYETLKQEQAQQKDDLLKKAAADLLKETTPPRVITEAEYLAKPEVRKEWREQQEAQQLKEIERNAALDRMGADRAAGKEINHKDLSHLNHADLQSIKDRGEAALQELIQQRQQELERQRERDRLTREFQQNGREITRHS
jgi:hypothetical protein